MCIEGTVGPSFEWHESGISVKALVGISTLKGQCREIFFRFFHESSSPKPLIIPEVAFRFFRKFAEMSASQGAIPMSLTSMAKVKVGWHDVTCFQFDTP
jgi:hypothetical protein